MSKTVRDYDREELPRAIKLAMKVTKKDGRFTISDMMTFGQMIGYPHNPYSGNHKIIDTDNPEVRKIIDVINGHNGKAIIRMLAARNLSEDKDI